MLDNYMDKEKRKLNVVVYNLPEQGEPGDSAAERTRKDTDKLCSIIREELRLNIRVSKAFRAGKKLPEKPRLLIVTLDSVEARVELTKMASQLRNSAEWHSLFINPDLTQKEREDGKKLRQELAARKSAGERNLYIRHGKIVQGPRDQHPEQTQTSQRPPAGTVTTPRDCSVIATASDQEGTQRAPRIPPAGETEVTTESSKPRTDNDRTNGDTEEAPSSIGAQGPDGVCTRQA